MSRRGLGATTRRYVENAVAAALPVAVVLFAIDQDWSTTRTVLVGAVSVVGAFVLMHLVRVGVEDPVSSVDAVVDAIDEPIVGQVAALSYSSIGRLVPRGDPAHVSLVPALTRVRDVAGRNAPQVGTSTAALSTRTARAVNGCW